MSAMTDLLKNRYRGALIGALVGDCYGAPFESKRVDPSTTLENLEQMSKDAAKVLHYTDDTAMTISTCKSLLDNNGMDPRHMAREFSEGYFKEPADRGYGAAVRTVFKLLRQTKCQDPYGPAASQFDGHGSYGNGAAMRCVGIGLFASKKNLSEARTIELTESCSRLTHTHPHGVNGASLLVLAVQYVLEQAEDSLDEATFLNHLIAKITPLEEASKRIYSEKLKSILGALERLTVSGHDVSQSEIVSLLGNDVSAQNSVPLAIYSFLRGISKFTDSYKIDNEFVRTLHWAISCGGDTDTIASMACGLCGAYLGLSKIPVEYYKNCESHQDILALADRMIDA